ncbi:hypothetical protein [Micromonospora sp. NBC_01796]|uniref:hypothetical protein n=1 Tax=Micromonospora sp. NBC_01796 TaxID=2975987 RepID=UPI002DD8601A|nr:hypothetical protein [Micromonospora sp. NBC_01796]WSA85485.1 hypothetical protein OIE47_34910 [Micromonospora sp. NBC_01796]
MDLEEKAMNMALSDKLGPRVAPFLEPGEIPRHTFLAQGGLNPWIANSFGAIGLIALAKRRIVAVTDHAIVVLETNLNGTKPTKVLARHPRHSQLGPVKGIWPKISVGHEKLYVHWRFHKQVRAADGDLLS